MNNGLFPSHEATITRGLVFRRHVFMGNTGSSVNVNWRRPPGVTHVRVELAGGGGGGNNTTAGGNAGRGAAVILLPVGMGVVPIVAGAGGVHLSSGGGTSSFGAFISATGGGYGGGDGTRSFGNGAVLEDIGAQLWILGPNVGNATTEYGGGNPGGVLLEYVQPVEVVR
jgi:hypothetical protein